VNACRSGLQQRTVANGLIGDAELRADRCLIEPLSAQIGDCTGEFERLHADRLTDIGELIDAVDDPDHPEWIDLVNHCAVNFKLVVRERIIRVRLFDLWLTNDGGGKPKYKAPYVEVFVLDTTGFTDAESAVAHALKSGDLHLGQLFVELKPEEIARFFKRCRISLVPREIFTAGG
jgi:hypothetical protein